MVGRVQIAVEKLQQQAVAERNLARTAASKAIAAIHTSVAEGYEALAKTTATQP